VGGGDSRIEASFSEETFGGIVKTVMQRRQKTFVEYYGGFWLWPVVVLVVAGCSSVAGARQVERSWLAGDHHIHSRYSTGWNWDSNPPLPIIGGDAIYPIPMNALMAHHFGLDWMVATDHGGPNHSRVNMERAYPELLQSREVVPDLIQFYGMEFDTPGAIHSSLIIPHSHEEVDDLYDVEHRYAKYDVHPRDTTLDTEASMLEALGYMERMDRQPLLLANHPSRSATGLGVYGAHDPAEMRGWNDTAPNVAVGMEGAPGHQAYELNRDGSLGRGRPRGAYGNFPTMGGFDQMTARLGGYWDSMLAEGRHWWITANSDAHVNWREGGADFWPGEYSKTYVWAARSYDDILNGIREGRVFVTTGDLISQLHVDATSIDGGVAVGIGGTLEVAAGTTVRVTVKFLDPTGTNHRGENPEVVRVDLIGGDITGRFEDPNTDFNPTTRVLHRFESTEWERDGVYNVFSYTIENIETSQYVRIRGTNSSQLEPEPDPIGEDPWSDLWFYSNPVFIKIR